MTEREEQAITVLNTLYNNPLLSDIHRQALEVGIMAIKGASRSEKPNKWIGAEVLDKIRTEIDSYCSDNRDRNDGLYIAMGIIDKYQASPTGTESEETE